MRKLYLLLLLLPLVSAHHASFDETGVVDPELLSGYSKSFSLSDAEVNLENENYFEVEITNTDLKPLVLSVAYPDFLSGNTQLEVEGTHTLQVKVDNSKNSFGVIEFKVSDVSLFLPVTHVLGDGGAFDIFEISMASDVYFAGKDAEVKVKITEDKSEFTKQTTLSFTLFSKDNQKVLESTKTIEVDALFDEEVSLYLPEYLSKGDYMLFVEADYGGRSDYDSSLFSLDEEEAANSWIYALFIAIIGLFVFLIHNSHKHLGKLRKIHTKHSLSIQRHRATSAESEIVEKKLSSIRAAYLEGAISKKNYDSVVKKLRNRLEALRLGLKKRPKK
jgi:hypothetical protein